PEPAAPPAPKPAASPVMASFPRPQPKGPPQAPPPAAPMPAEPLELEPLAEDPFDSEFQEIDLSADPDISDLSNAADTRALGLEFHVEPTKPTLSEQVVDTPLGAEERSAPSKSADTGPAAESASSA